MTNNDIQFFARTCIEAEIDIAKEFTDGKIKCDECLYRLLLVILEFKKRTFSDNSYQK